MFDAFVKSAIQFMKKWNGQKTRGRLGDKDLLRPKYLTLVKDSRLIRTHILTLERYKNHLSPTNYWLPTYKTNTSSNKWRPFLYSIQIVVWTKTDLNKEINIETFPLYLMSRLGSTCKCIVTYASLGNFYWNNSGRYALNYSYFLWRVWRGGASLCCLQAINYQNAALDW